MRQPVPQTMQDHGLVAARRFREAWEAGEWDYGQVIPRAWIEQAMGLSGDGIITPEETAIFRGQWMHAMAKFRSALLHDLKVLITTSSDPGGYYIVRPEEQTAYAVHEFSREINRASKRSSEIADNTNIDRMTAEQRREAADHRAVLRRMQTAIGGVLIQATAAVPRLETEAE